MSKPLSNLITQFRLEIINRINWKLHRSNPGISRAPASSKSDRFPRQTANKAIRKELRDTNHLLNNDYIAFMISGTQNWQDKAV